MLLKYKKIKIILITAMESNIVIKNLVIKNISPTAYIFTGNRYLKIVPGNLK